MSEITQADSSFSTQDTVTEVSRSVVAEVAEQPVVDVAQAGSQSDSSDTDDEQYKWTGGMPRAPLVSSLAGPKPKHRVDTRSKEYLAKSSKKKTSDSASSISSASSNTIVAEDSNTKEDSKETTSNKKSGK